MKKTFKLVMLTAAVLIAAGSLSQPTRAQGGAALLKQVEATPEMLTQGETLFKANCASCHGAEGKGDGQPALKPRNFHSKDAWKNGPNFAGMYKTLEEGLPGTAMSSFSQLSAKDRVAIIHHIRKLAPSVYPPITAGDVETLDKTYQLGEAMNKTGVSAIPVDKAIELLIKEAEPQQAKVKAAMGKLMAGHDKGTQMILDSTSNPERALTFLNNAGAAWKGSSADFAKMVMYNSDTSGFRVATGTYGPGQWSELQNALKKLL